MTMRPFTVEEARARRRHFARALGGRDAQIPEYIAKQLGAWPSRHYFALRLPEGLLIWFECWCNHEGVIEAKRQEAKVIASRGFRVAFISTTFSTNWVGERRPLLVTLLDNTLNFENVVERLSPVLSATEPT
jgi:hypothetical protein